MHWTKTNFVNITTNYEEIRKTHAETRSTSKMEPFVKIMTLIRWLFSQKTLSCLFRLQLHLYIYWENLRRQKYKLHFLVSYSITNVFQKSLNSIFELYKLFARTKLHCLSNYIIGTNDAVCLYGEQYLSWTFSVPYFTVLIMDRKIRSVARTPRNI